MDFIKRWWPNRPQRNGANPVGEGSAGNVTPENQPNALARQPEDLLRAPARRRRHFSDAPAILLPHNLQAQADQNGGLSLRQQVARGVLEFASGYPNTRAEQRRLLQVKSMSSLDQALSVAHPANFAHFFFNDFTRPVHFNTVLRMPPLSKDEKEKHAWNDQDSSVNIFVKASDPLTLHRLPVAQSTDCIRGKVGYSSGFHVWRIDWPTNQRGTHPMLGVATKEAPLHKTGYISLLGLDALSYGWDINRKKCFHDSGTSKDGWSYPFQSVVGNTRSFEVPAKIYCILDMDDGYLAFATEDKYLGVAFRGLKGKTLFPIVSAVWGHCEISIKYLGGLEGAPRTLMDVCRREVRIQMRGQNFDSLDLPPMLKSYLVHKW